MEYFIPFFIIVASNAIYAAPSPLLNRSDSAHELLVQLLLSNAQSGMRPIVHPKDKLTIHVLGALYQIVDVDQRNNLATISAYFDLWWMDPFLKWDPVEHDGVEEMYLPTAKVWTPELYLYHSIEGSIPLHLSESAVQVEYSGKVRTFVPFTARALCPINVKYFPFDEQKCNFTFGSWSYRAESVEYNVSSKKVFLEDFYDNQEWILLDAHLNNGDSKYTTDWTNETYSTVVMEIELRRQSFYYVFNLVFPTTLVSITAVLGFHAPANSGPRRESKYRLGIMTLLSMGVMLLMVVDQMPKFSLASIPGQRGSFSDVPLLGIFYLELILIISICTCATSTFVLLESYALKHPDVEDVPFFLRWIDFDWPWTNCCRKRRSKSKKVTGNRKSDRSELVTFAPDVTNSETKVTTALSNSTSLNNHIGHSSSFNHKGEEKLFPPPPLSANNSFRRTRSNNYSSEESSDADLFTSPLKCDTFLPSTRLTSPQSPRQFRRIGTVPIHTQSTGDSFDRLSRYFLSSQDAMHLIAQRMVQIQQKMDNNTNTLLYGHKGRGGLASSGDSKNSILPPWWARIIGRLESLSLVFYLGCIVTAFVLFFYPFWWY